MVSWQPEIFYFLKTVTYVSGISLAAFLILLKIFFESVGKRLKQWAEEI